MRQHQTFARILLAATMVLPATVAPALSFQSPLAKLRKLPVSGRSVWLHPFNDQMAGFGLYNRGSIGFDRAVISSLRERLANPLVEIRGETVSGLSLVPGSSTHEFQYYVAGIPLCGFQVRAHALSSKRAGLVLGAVPDIDPDAASSAVHAEWPDVNVAFEHAATAANEDADADAAVLKQATRCFYVTNGSLLPVWQLRLVAGELPYTALADGYELVDIQRAYFDVDGTAKVFDQNIVSGTQKNYKLTGLAGNGTLKSDYLQVIVPDDYEAAVEDDHVYNYSKTDAKFPQVQAYANVQRHFDYFKDLGFEWYGTAPLQVKLHVVPNGRKNNALFMPGGSDGTLPSISIHDGDGEELQYLATDGDVVSHEFGHHVVYKTLRSTEGQSLVLHEGLADFFAFSRTGDACLGESICPAGSNICIVENQCLRTAEIELAYEDDLWMRFAGPSYRLGHQHGQMISGMLWDIRKAGTIPADVLSKLVFQAVQYFKADSGFRDFMLALMIADSELHGGQYNAAIRAAGDARGLSEFYEDVAPGSEIPDPEGGGALLPDEGDGEGTTKKKSEDKDIFDCGVVGGAGGQGPALLLILAMLFPFITAARPALARLRARRDAKRTR
jgi:hypothetical protein